ncbi:hypothetical protein [Mycolicibacterium sp.]|uniref:hypothetical protein n=1 Tax=Mycolicibacterium sp. TaxID=2320850 RepID=UPI0035610D39
MDTPECNWQLRRKRLVVSRAVLMALSGARLAVLASALLTVTPPGRGGFGALAPVSLVIW